MIVSALAIILVLAVLAWEFANAVGLIRRWRARPPATTATRLLAGSQIALRLYIAALVTFFAGVGLSLIPKPNLAAALIVAMSGIGILGVSGIIGGVLVGRERRSAAAVGEPDLETFWPNRLKYLRRVLMFQIAALVFLGLALAYIVPWNGRGDSWLSPLVVFGIGVGALLGVRAVLARALDVTSAPRLAATYVAATMTGVGFAMSPALVGFAAALVIDGWWVYGVGMAFSVAGIAPLLPTRGNLHRRQEQIERLGSTLSLADALA